MCAKLRTLPTETLGPDISMPATVKKYTWGLDLSESLQGAGGIGGLLWERVNNNEASFALYDGNGNVTAYVAGNGVYQQAYKYDAFLNATPVIVNGASYRFQASTKSYNARYGLLDYQLRSYCPILGRWIQEDHQEELGGLNLYGFCFNNGVMYIDVYGLGFWDSSFVIGIGNAVDWADNNILGGNFDNISNFSSGMGDVISGGLTDKVRDHMGTNDYVNKNSTAYSAGEITGAATNMRWLEPVALEWLGN